MNIVIAATNLLNRLNTDKEVIEKGWWQEEREVLEQYTIKERDKKMTKSYRSMPIKYSVYHKDSNPIFGEETTHIEIEDKADGGYIVLTQFPDEGKQQLRFDLKELEEILIVANKMMAIYEHNELGDKS